MADRTETVLLAPEVIEPPSAPQGICHLHAEARFQVEFPFRVVGIGFPSDLGVPLNASSRGEAEPVPVGLAFLVFGYPEEPPVPGARATEVAVGHPVPALIGVSSFCPLPQGAIQGIVHTGEGCLADDMPVVVRPA